WPGAAAGKPVVILVTLRLVLVVIDSAARCYCPCRRFGGLSVRAELAVGAARAVRHGLCRLVCVDVEAPALTRVEPRAAALLAGEESGRDHRQLLLHRSLVDRIGRCYS